MPAPAFPHICICTQHSIRHKPMVVKVDSWKVPKMRLYISVISFRLVLAVVKRALQKLHREMLGSNSPVVLVVVQITPFFFLPHIIS